MPMPLRQNVLRPGDSRRLLIDHPLLPAKTFACLQLYKPTSHLGCVHAQSARVGDCAKHDTSASVWPCVICARRLAVTREIMLRDPYDDGAGTISASSHHARACA